MALSRKAIMGISTLVIVLGGGGIFAYRVHREAPFAGEMQVFNQPPRGKALGCAYVRGKILMLSKRRFASVHWDLPDALMARSPGDVGTVVHTRPDGYKVAAAVVDLRGRKVLVRRSFGSSSALLSYLTTLPRHPKAAKGSLCKRP